MRPRCRMISPRCCAVIAPILVALLLAACTGRAYPAPPAGAGTPGAVRVGLPIVAASKFPSSGPPPGPSAGVWKPALNTSWQWQLTGTLDLSLDVPVYDIDLFDNSADVVASLHAKGRKAICYFSAGTWENWRPDADQFAAGVKGNGNGWAGERWLDIRKLDSLGPIMAARMDACQAKGFDAVEPDNVDGYSNGTGFPLTYEDQLRYNRWLADQAHARGLSVGLKNDGGQAKDLWPAFDWALNEQCFEFSECEPFADYFVNNGKAVFQVEYNLNTSQFCAQANRFNFNALKKRLELDAWRQACR